MYEQEATITFDWLEYCVCASMMGLSAFIGVYYAVCSKQNTVSEYLLGGKRMGIFPIAMSLIASHISCIALLGVPVEIFTYGIQYMFAIPSSVFGVVIIVYGFIPVFYNLQLISVNEYLEMRFSKAVRKMASLLFGIFLLLYIPVIVYTVSLAFEEVSKINVFVVAPVVSIICIFYTTMGGLKAVVWTDTLQGLITICTILIISVLGTIKAGGLQSVLQTSKEGGVFQLDMDPSPFHRLTVWTVFIGNIFSVVAYFGTHAGSVQRFAALPTLRHANWSVVLMAIGTGFIFFLCGYLGLVLFTMYHDCNPMTSERIKRMDQMLPYLIMHTEGSFRGLPGLFMAGVFSAALGAMSASLNTLAGLIYEDFLSQYLPKNITEQRASDIMKLLAVILGGISVVLVFFVDKLKGLIQISMSFTGLSTGASLGIFVLGMFFPTANKKGALYGGLTSLSVMAWIVFMTQMKQMSGALTHMTLASSIENCPYNVSVVPATTRAPDHNDEVFILFRLSFTMYVMVGSLIVIAVGLIVSHLTGPTKVKDVNPDLISPLVKTFYYKKESPAEEEMYVTMKLSPNSSVLVER